MGVETVFPPATRTNNSGWHYAESYPYMEISNPPVGSLAEGKVYSWEGFGWRKQFQNAEFMMDMSFLCHDAGVSGTRNPGTDRYEFLKESYNKEGLTFQDDYMNWDCICKTNQNTYDKCEPVPCVQRAIHFFHERGSRIILVLLSLN